MPLMTKIRDSMTTVFAVFAGLFVVYIVLDWGMDITGRKQARMQSKTQEIGSVNGKLILYTDFAERLKLAADNLKAQTNAEPDEEDMKRLQDQVWDQIVDQELYGAEIKRLGITVSDQEIVDWVRGSNPPEFLKTQFTDSTGNFNRQAYESAIQDPRNKAIWVRVESALRLQREQEKLQSVVLAGLRVSEGDVLQKFTDQTIRYNADYILLDPNKLIPENEATVTDADARKYYNEHSDEYKVEATRKLKYVTFSETASPSDSDAVRSELDDVAKRVKKGTDFLELAKTYSEVPISDAYFKHGELSKQKEEAIFSVKAGSIIGPISESDGFHLIKVLDFRTGADEYVRASHILLPFGQDSTSALKHAKEILAEAKRGVSFAKLAEENSQDGGSKTMGGDLGWFGKGKMVKEFETAAFKASPGQIVGPVRTQYGYHIIKVTAKDKREVKVADISMAVKASSQTKGTVSQQAQDFAYLAKQSSFELEATQSKYTIVETQAFQKNSFIPGFGMNAALNKFAFNNKLGAVSEPMTVQNGLGVFTVSEVKEAGIRPYDEIKSTIEARAKREKKMEKLKVMAEELQKSFSPNDSLQTISARRPDLRAQHLASFTLSVSLTEIGRDPGFLGGIATLEPGQISKPIEGQRGYYIIKLLSKSAFDSVAYNTQKDILKTQILTDRRTRYVREWSDNLKKSADIVDNRDLFYR